MIYICKWLLVCVMGNKGLLCSVTPIPRKKQQLNYYFRFLIRFVSVICSHADTGVSSQCRLRNNRSFARLTADFNPNKGPRLATKQKTTA